MPKINWNAVEDSQFTLIPEGDYEVKIQSIIESATQGGDEMWKLTLVIEEGEFKNQKLFTNLVFSEKGYGNIKKLYSAIYGSKLPKVCETTDLLDENVIVTVVHNQYNGKTYANVAYAGFESATKKSVSNNESEIFG